MNKDKLLEQGFTADQIAELEAGAKQNIDISIYADKRFLAVEMREIRKGLEAGLDVSVYAKPEYDWFQMEEIRKGLLTGLPIEKYAYPDLSYDRMKQIRLGLCEDIDLTPFKHLMAGKLKQLRLALMSKVKIVSFINQGYDTEQLEAIREALEKKIDIEPYLDIHYRGIAIREIVTGLEHGVDVTYYANPEYQWQQMREIRIGLEHRVDVNRYSNKLYGADQMKEIRLGLEEGLEVSYFNSLRYAAVDMRRKRLELMEHPALALGKPIIAVPEAPEKIRISLEEENTKAYVSVGDMSQDDFRIEMMKALHKLSIITGVDYKTIDGIRCGTISGKHALIASGSLPVDGADGYYEYFVRTHVTRTPRETEDGAVDYRNVDWYEVVKKGQKLATYHSAEKGQSGITVTGDKIPARKGREKCIITGKGFHRTDGNTYISDLDGVFTYSEKYNDDGELAEIRIDITELLVVEEVTLATGDVHFKGNVYVKGSVGSGAGVFASGDILIGGFVESSMINAGGSVMIRQGMNASGSGEIQAGGDVNGLFFENVKIEAGGSITADYYMNCDLSAREMVTTMGKKAGLVGGLTCADCGLKVGQLGNQAGLFTHIKLGISDRLIKEELQIAETMKTVASELETFKKAYEDLMNRFSPQVRSNSELFIKLGNAIFTKEQEMKELAERLQFIETRKKEVSGACAIIDNKLYENVLIEIDGAKVKTSSTLLAVKVKKEGNKVVMTGIR